MITCSFCGRGMHPAETAPCSSYCARLRRAEFSAQDPSYMRRLHMFGADALPSDSACDARQRREVADARFSEFQELLSRTWSVSCDQGELVIPLDVGETDDVRRELKRLACEYGCQARSGDTRRWADGSTTVDLRIARRVPPWSGGRRGEGRQCDELFPAEGHDPMATT